MSRLFGDIPEDTTQGKKSLYDVLPSQPRLASICRNVPEDGQPYRSPSPRAYEVHSDSFTELSLVESDRELFASIVSVFPTLDPGKFIEGQKSEFSQYFKFLDDPDHSPLSRRETLQSASNFFVVDGVLYRSYLPKRSSFRDKLVVPSVLRSLIMQACHDLPASGGHLAFTATFDRVRDRHWWPIMQGDVKSYCTSCDAYQRRKTSHRPTPLPTGHVPVHQPFQRVAIDLVEYKTASQGC